MPTENKPDSGKGGLRPLRPHDEPAPDLATVYAIFDEDIPAGEYRYWRSPVYVSDELNSFPIRCCAVVQRQGGDPEAFLILFAQANIRTVKHALTAEQAVCWLVMPDHNMLWTRDRRVEQFMATGIQEQPNANGGAQRPIVFRGPIPPGMRPPNGQ